MKVRVLIVRKGTVNSVVIEGRVGQRPEAGKTKNGGAVATMSIAATETYKDRNGEKKAAL